MTKIFTKKEIKILGESPYIKHVAEKKLVFTYEFRLILWEHWSKSPNLTTIREIVEQYGLDPKVVGNLHTKRVQETFKRNGKPSGATNETFGEKKKPSFKTNIEDNEYLISTGKFIAKGNGIAFHPDFVDELYTNYPNQSIDEGLINAGIDPKRVGKYRIRDLRRSFEKKKSQYTDEFISNYENHPYVSQIKQTEFVLTKQFYNEACLLSSKTLEINHRLVLYDLSINEILNVFEIDGEKISIAKKNNIKKELIAWNRINCESVVSSNTDLLLKIVKNYNEQLEIAINYNFNVIKENVSSLSHQQRKLLCEWVQSIPNDIKQHCKTRWLLDKVGISKSSYYSILKSDKYGNHELEKQIRDDSAVLLIIQVMEYKGYPKGARMIYMMMKNITGKQFGLNKIKRLMKKYSLESGVRKANPSRRGNKKLLEIYVKPNILKRRFKIERPLITFVTDVSYLKYSGKTAYLSVIKDASSGRIVACVVSKSNDLDLVLNTLEQFINFIENHEYPLGENALLHSDQGSLYLSDVFQNKVKLLNLIQSMSKRGNCWDNASQETYFGHFKDECVYSDCDTFEELQVMIHDYVYYYNYERPQWDRMKMTPINFEKHLLSMNEEDFKDYQAIEIDKYNKMMEKAKDKAKKRVENLGVN